MVFYEEILEALDCPMCIFIHREDGTRLQVAAKRGENPRVRRARVRADIASYPQELLGELLQGGNLGKGLDRSDLARVWLATFTAHEFPHKANLGLGEIKLGYAKAQPETYGDIPGFSQGDHVFNQIGLRLRESLLKERTQAVVIFWRRHLLLEDFVDLFNLLD